MTKVFKSFTFKVFLVTVFLFVVIFPLSNSINFHQNDDWVYYRTIENFLKNKFVLHSDIEASFYLQAVLGFLFAAFFGITKLPVLTLLFSVLNFFVFTLIVYRFYGRNKLTALVLGLFFFFTPMHTYSILGFMSDNYFILFFLIAIYFTKAYFENHKFVDFLGLNVGIALGFLVRQFSILLYVPVLLSLLLKRKFKLFFLQILFIATLFKFDDLFLPKTLTMNYSHDVSFKNLITFNYHPYNLLPLLLYIGVFLFPLIIARFSHEFKKTNLPKLLLITGTSLIVFVALSFLLQPIRQVSTTLFYLPNVIQQSGYMYSEFLGNKPPLIGGNNIYMAWDFISKISFGIFVGLVLVNFKKSINMYSILIGSYVFSLLTFILIFDRYTLLLVPLGILFILELGTDFLTKKALIFISAFLILFAVYDYQFSMDFVRLNNYLWSKASEISRIHKIDESYISAGFPWIREFPNKERKVTKSFSAYKYIFSFDSTPNFDFPLTQVESKKIDFPFSAFQETTVNVFKVDQNFK